MSLANALHTKEITTVQVDAVGFGFFSPEEVRKISVKQITSPIIFDNLKQPIKGGLYDPALGPLDPKDKCSTCKLGYYECPGHFGHVELSVPLYNPLVFTTLYKLLRCVCLHCYRFRMAGKEVERYQRRLELLANGQLQEARALNIGSSQAAKKKGGEMGEEIIPVEAIKSDGNMGKARSKDHARTGYECDATTNVSFSATRGARDMGPRSPSKLTSQTLEAMINTVADFFRRQPTGKCQNCGAHNPTVRREGHNKIFVLRLPAKRQAANATQSTPILDDLKILSVRSAVGMNGELGERGKAKHSGPLRGQEPRDAPTDDDKDDIKDVDMLDFNPEEDKKVYYESKDELLEDSKDSQLDSFDDKEAEKIAATHRKSHLQSSSQNDAHHAAESDTNGASGPQYLTPTEVRQILHRVWEENERILAFIYPTDVARRERRRGSSSTAQRASGSRGYQDLFVQTVPVAPNRFRPINRVGDAMYEHPQNILLSKLINGNLDLVALSKGESQTGLNSNARASNDTSLGPQAILGRTLRLWLDLQNSLNALFDSSSAEETHGVHGIRQQLEKKEGLFRKNMMGKRVNFAARSVISPDVYLNGGEIGVPPYFASRLSFPERVTPWNVDRLREAVLAGPGRNPGAIAVEDERGRIIMLRKDKKSREAVAKTLYAVAPGSSSMMSPSIGSSLTPPATAASPTQGQMTSPPSARSISNATTAAAQYGGGKVVYRTMQDGDFMLTNRQPTLHKPGMMGHRARIMRAERTIRFHYANCSTFNADFDGDEINLHLPQDHLCRAEGYDIVHADHQFFVPTDGKPLRGLIQDHIVSGTLLTMKDRFLTQQQYSQLIYECVAPDCSGAWDIWMEPPTILAPRQLWTGKQVITAVLMHYTRDQLPFHMAGDCKVPEDVWGKGTGEGQLHIYRNHLITGCVDKAAFGKHGLLHVFHELYGPDRTSTFTAALSRLFTAFIQHHGFTCGMSDVFLIEQAEEERENLLAEADLRALEAAAAFVNVPGPTEKAESSSVPLEESINAVEQEVRAALRDRFRTNSTETGAALDMTISGAMHPLSSEVVKACLPKGQVKPFRHNMMALMTVTGAKGSVVNFSQISCLLGQQELEGRRVPRMASGKTLPCFSAYDSEARSGGFVGDRFLSGLRPQEYYFHCMAGREGLVDTTVKTSRSGYLQRCLVKNLEPLRVSYDSTVRDDCDGSIIQFLYGEDGVDTTQTGCLRTLPLLFYNLPQFAIQIEGADALAAARHGRDSKEMNLLEAEAESALSYVRKRAKARFQNSEAAANRRLPLNATFMPSVLGVTSEGFQDALDDALFGGLMLPPNTEDISAIHKLGIQRSKKALKKRRTQTFAALDAADFQSLMHVKFYGSQAQPGEAVGIVAAQSIGEPSTQMTLNTFHMAGRGEANVTLGIPRLREILMTAAASIKTPVMTLPLWPHHGDEAAKSLAVRLKRIFLAEAAKRIWVEENVVASPAAGTVGRTRSYAVKMEFYPPSAYPKELKITVKEVQDTFYRVFVPRLKAAIKIELKRAKTGSTRRLATARVSVEDGNAILSSEADAPVHKKRSEKDDDDENREENEENEEGKMRFTGGHGEQATYDAGDEEDLAIAKNVQEEANRRGMDVVVDDDDDDGGSGGDKDNNDDVDGGSGGKHPKRFEILEVTDGADDRDQSMNMDQDVMNEKNIYEQRKEYEQLETEEAMEHDGGSPSERIGFTCSHTVALDVDDPKLLVREIVERVAARTTMRGVPGIAKCYVLDAANTRGRSVVQTDGINICGGAWLQSDLVDVSQATTNSPAAMLELLGVEAARATIVREVSSVFGAYGIAVDPRHLSLIADHMTHMGGYKACNRIGIDASTSPFLKISFETAASFLVAATLHGDIDPLTSPAARIVVGRPVKVGTGSMDIVQGLK